MDDDNTCTGITASWCPIHGDCTCPRHTEGAMENEVIDRKAEDHQCPLHSSDSEHAETPEPGPRTWPYTTPSGHTYVEPATYAELQARVNDAAQAWVETWDLAEHPPGPTWAMVGLAQVEVRRLRAALEDVLEDVLGIHAEFEAVQRAHDAALTEEITTRDHYHELLDRFAYAVAPQSVIGEHTSMNSPWLNALEILAARSAEVG